MDLSTVSIDIIYHQWRGVVYKVTTMNMIMLIYFYLN